jgi:hypothetical protein
LLPAADASAIPEADAREGETTDLGAGMAIQSRPTKLTGEKDRVGSKLTPSV